jgi:hypothetical protein
MGDCHLSTFWENTLDMKDLIIGLAGVCWIMAEGIGRTWAELIGKAYLWTECLQWLAILCSSVDMGS